MMKTNRGSVIVVLVVVAVFGIGIASPLYAGSSNRMVTEAVIIIDISKSVDQPCEAAGKTTQEILALPYARSSSILVLVTGDSSTSDEPRLLGRFPMPLSGTLIEGHGRMSKEAQNLPERIIQACRNVSRTDVSPVFLAIKSGLQQLRNFECGKEIRCLLLAVSDGEENAERNVKSALDGNTLSLTSLKGKLDNTNVETALCGISETMGQEREKTGTPRTLTKKRNGERRDRLDAVWMSLFKDPARVHVYSFCPPAGPLSPSARSDVSAPLGDLHQ